MSTVKRFLAVLLVVLVALSGCAQLQQRLQDLTDGPVDRGAGSNYEELLAGSTGTLLVEVSHSPGALWNNDAKRDFRQEVQRITQKDIRITASADLPENGGNYRYSLSELQEFHATHQDRQDDADRVVMHALFLDGEYQRDNVAGLAFAGSGFALFKGEIREKTCSNDALVCDGVREWKVTRSVAVHEAGHLFGLVNCPLPMVTPHEMTSDPNPETEPNEGKCHSQNDDSVMFWKVERSRGLDDLIGEGDVPSTFDDKDIQDAREIQG